MQELFKLECNFLGKCECKESYGNLIICNYPYTCSQKSSNTIKYIKVQKPISPNITNLKYLFFSAISVFTKTSTTAEPKLTISNLIVPLLLYLQKGLFN